MFCKKCIHFLLLRRLWHSCQEQRFLQTFITPQGRFNKLPFGICGAPEHFQNCMSRILTGLDGVLSSIDDIFIFGKDKKEHDVRLRAATRTGSGSKSNIKQ